MLSDWIWSTAIVLSVWLEIGLFSTIIRRWLCLGHAISLGVAAAALSQLWFILSLVGLSHPKAHLTIAIFFAILLTTVVLRGAPRLHLKLARGLSPLSWTRAWPWLLLPSLWLVVRFVDALAPHPDPWALGINLQAAHRWFEDGAQRLDALQPILGAASIWDALHFHVQGLSHLAPAHATALTRGHIASQLLHFTLGQLLAVALMAEMVLPLIRSDWAALALAAGGPLKRVHAGTASHTAWPAALNLAWIAAASSTLTQPAVAARNDWGALALALTGVLLGMNARPGLAWFAWGSAIAANSSLAATGAGLLFVTIHADGWRLSTARRAVVGLTLALMPWAIRNFWQAGTVVFPSQEPGWLTETALTRLIEARTFSPKEGVLYTALLVTGGVGFALALRERIKGAHEPLRLFAGFTASFMLASLSLRHPTLDRAVLLLLSAVVGGHLLTVMLARRLPQWFARAIPFGWLLVSLLAISVPYHVVWQNLSFLSGTTARYLEEAVPNYSEKHWMSVHLPPKANVAWVGDRQLYYSLQPGATLSDASALHAPLLSATNPRDRLRILCDLGFDYLAWDEHRQGPETTGLQAWLRVTETTVALQTARLTVYQLDCREP